MRFEDELRTSKTLPAIEGISKYLVNNGYQDILWLSKVQSNWELIVGSGLSKKAWPVYLNKGILRINTSDAAYTTALRYNKHDILSNIRVAIQSTVIKDLSFSVADENSLRIMKPKYTYS